MQVLTVVRCGLEVNKDSGSCFVFFYKESNLWQIYSYIWCFCPQEKNWLWVPLFLHVFLDVPSFRRICKNKSWKMKIDHFCIWKLHTSLLSYDAVYPILNYTGKYSPPFFFIQFALDNMGICKKKKKWFHSKSSCSLIWRQQSHTLWNKLVTYQKLAIDLPVVYAFK